MLRRLLARTGSALALPANEAAAQQLCRSSGEASTSYTAETSTGSQLQLMLVRCMSGKGKGGKGGAKAAAAPATPVAKPAVAISPHLASAGMRLRRHRRPDLMALLTPEQRALAAQLVPPDPTAARSDAAAADSALPGSLPPGQLHGLGQLGLPLDRRDVASLLHQSLSNAAGQNVQFRPHTFSNIFQSASATASYVASAMESGSAWSRVERFFLASVEADNIVRGVRVAVRGRLGRKAGKASRKVWEWGEVSLRTLSDPLDYGMATAHTRMGALGVKVWIRYKSGAVQQGAFPSPAMNARAGQQHGAATTPLDELYRRAAQRAWRLALPYQLEHVAWWARPAQQKQQPPESLFGQQQQQLFVGGVDGGDAAEGAEGAAPPSAAAALHALLSRGGYDPSRGRLTHYLARLREARARFRSMAEWRRYVATRGRYLQREYMATIARRPSTSPAEAAAQGRLGRRSSGVGRPLARRLDLA